MRRRKRRIRIRTRQRKRRMEKRGNEREERKTEGMLYITSDRKEGDVQGVIGRG